MKSVTRRGAAAVLPAQLPHGTRQLRWQRMANAGNPSQGLNPMDSPELASTVWRKRQFKEWEANLEAIHGRQFMAEFLQKKEEELTRTDYVRFLAEQLQDIDPTWTTDEQQRVLALWQSLVKLAPHYIPPFVEYRFLLDDGVRGAFDDFKTDAPEIEHLGFAFAKLMSRVAQTYEQSVDAARYLGHCTVLRRLALDLNDSDAKAPLLQLELAKCLLRRAKSDQSTKYAKEALDLCDRAVVHYEGRGEAHPDALVVNRSSALLLTKSFKACEEYLGSHSVSAAAQKHKDLLSAQAREMRKRFTQQWSGDMAPVKEGVAAGQQATVVVDFDGYTTYLSGRGVLSRFLNAEFVPWVLESLQEWAEVEDVRVVCVMQTKESAVWPLCDAMSHLIPVQHVARGTLKDTLNPDLVVATATANTNIVGRAVNRTLLQKEARDAGLLCGDYAMLYDITSQHINLPHHGHEQDPMALPEAAPQPYGTPSNHHPYTTYPREDGKGPTDRAMSKEYQRKRKERKMRRMQLVDKRELENPAEAGDAILARVQAGKMNP